MKSSPRVNSIGLRISPGAPAESISRTESGSWSRRGWARRSARANSGPFKDYYDHVIADTTGEELIALLDALTTNFTSFLREPAHFDLLRKTIVPRASGARSASGARHVQRARSPGPSLSLCSKSWDRSAADRIQILASDISSRALAIAERGAYEAERLRICPTTGEANIFFAVRSAGKDGFE